VLDAQTQFFLQDSVPDPASQVIPNTASQVTPDLASQVIPDPASDKTLTLSLSEKMTEQGRSKKSLESTILDHRPFKFRIRFY
jgi:hypothetical protein